MPKHFSVDTFCTYTYNSPSDETMHSGPPCLYTDAKSSHTHVTLDDEFGGVWKYPNSPACTEHW